MRKWAIIVPARLESHRLPRKPLQDLGGKPLIVRVCDNLRPMLDKGAKLVVATDNREILEVCEKEGYEAFMTQADHKSGTDRCNEVAQKLTREYVMNVQGDEPFAAILDLMALAECLEEKKDAQMATLVFGSKDLKAYDDPNVVKAVRAADGSALYFSRAPIPHYRDGDLKTDFTFWRHLGIYAYSTKKLNEYCLLQVSKLEITEKLEQLRALEAGWRIYLQVASKESLGIDTPEDLEAAREMF